MNELQHAFRENCDGLFIVRNQDIPDDLIEDLRSERLASSAVRSADLHRVASVPEFVFDLWIRQGRDPYNATPQDILRWLERDDLNVFITTNKAI